MTNHYAIKVIATALVICILAPHISARFLDAEPGMQGRVLATANGQKKKTDLGPQRVPKKSTEAKSSEKPAKAAKTKKKKEQYTAYRDWLKAKDRAEYCERAIKRYDNDLKELKTKLAAARKVFQEEKKNRRSTKYVRRAKLLAVLRLTGKMYAIKAMVKHYQTKHTQETATVTRLKSTVDKMDLAKMKKKHERRHGKNGVLPSNWKRKFKIQKIGHEMRAKLFHRRWGKKVSFAGDTKFLKVIYRFRSCLIKKCKTASPWTRESCRQQCRKEWG